MCVEIKQFLHAMSTFLIDSVYIYKMSNQVRSIQNPIKTTKMMSGNVQLWDGIHIAYTDACHQ